MTPAGFGGVCPPPDARREAAFPASGDGGHQLGPRSPATRIAGTVTVQSWSGRPRR